MIGLQRGVVISKSDALDLVLFTRVYTVTVQLEDDPCSSVMLVVTKELYESTCIAGLGHDVVIEFGTVLRVVPPKEKPVSSRESRARQQELRGRPLRPWTDMLGAASERSAAAR